MLTDAQFDLVARMNEAVRTHEVAMGLLADGVPEGVVRADYCGVPCQIRMDWFEPHRGIVDLKTCDDLTWFEADARRYGYVHQLAFYRAVLAQVVGVPMPVHLIAVEKKEPFRCGVWQVDADTLDRRAAGQRSGDRAAEGLPGRRTLAHRLRGAAALRLRLTRTSGGMACHSCGAHGWQGATD